MKDEVDGANLVDAEKRDESGGCRETLPTRTDAALSTTAKASEDYVDRATSASESLLQRRQVAFNIKRDSRQNDE